MNTYNKLKEENKIYSDFLNEIQDLAQSMVEHPEQSYVDGDDAITTIMENGRLLKQYIDSVCYSLWKLSKK